MIYVGIKNSIFKTTLLRNAKKGKKIKVCILNLAGPDCSRHIELLKIFDSVGKTKIMSKHLCEECVDSEYYKYQLSTSRSKRTIQKKIYKFYSLYETVVKKNKPVGKIIVSVDGARLDGSHRASIYVHLWGRRKTEVVEMDWAAFFNKKKTRCIRKHVKSQRKLYNLL